MHKKRIIPCLDVNNGRVVKGINFINLVDAGDPAEQAKIYNDQGADEICFLDITASNQNRNIMLDTVKKTAKKIFVPLTVGGGIKSVDDARQIIRSGADKICLNKQVIENPKLINEISTNFGNQCVFDLFQVQLTSWVNILYIKQITFWYIE